MGQPAMVIKGGEETIRIERDGTKNNLELLERGLRCVFKTVCIDRV